VGSIPEKIGTFEVIRQIGSGGMGAVYLGRDPELDRQVAIKVIREEVHEQEVLDRFFREARAAAALRHANIITVFASGQQDHKPYIAMEYIEGESFADIIKQRRNLPLADKISYLEQLCAGLAFAHKAGIVHRDVKPANIMIDREGVVRILDFGIARIEGSAMTQDGTMMGSLNYMSPEQMLGKPVDQRSDIFSVGSVSYELLCYQQAFKGNLNDGLLHRLPHEDPPLLKEIYPALPLAIEQVVMRALEKDPGRRYQNLTDMRTALVNAHAAGKQSAAVPVVQPVEDERTVVVARPKTDPPMAAPPAPPAAGGGYAGSLAPRATSQPASPVTLSELPPAPTPVPFIPVVTGLKLKSENVPATPPPAVEKPAAPPTPPPPARIAPPPSANIAVAPSPPSTRRAATVAGPTHPRTSSKKGMLIGVGVVVVAIGAAAAYLSGQFNPPPQDPLTVARPQIEAAMAEYRSAYRNRDLEGVVKVFPGLPADTRKTMQQAFENCLIYEVVFADMQVALDAADPNSAQVDVRSTHNCTPTSGGRQTNASHHDVFSLKKIGDAWLIAGSAPGSAGGPQ
jgi:serine/threonine-protein kinase